MSSVPATFLAPSRRRLASLTALVLAAGGLGGCTPESASRDFAVLGPVLEGGGPASVDPTRFVGSDRVLADATPLAGVPGRSD